MTTPSTHAELVIGFTNSLDLEEGTDELSSPSKLATWLAEAGLTASPPPVAPEEHAQFLRLRAGLREALDPDGMRPHVLADTDTVLREVPLLVSITSLLRGPREGALDVLVPKPDLPPALSALGIITASLANLLVTGEVARVKRCPMESCGWVFWDSSKNRSRRWCSMRVCGNRAKARSYAARHDQ